VITRAAPYALLVFGPMYGGGQAEDAHEAGRGRGDARDGLPARSPQGRFAVSLAVLSYAKLYGGVMIARVWHGWTTPENADAYEALLTSEVFPGIFAKNVSGFERIELFRQPLGDEVEFMTVMWFSSWDAVKSFAGEDYEAAYVPASARAVLKRFDQRSRHYEVRAQRASSAPNWGSIT
jgi:hypothetical protein